MCWKSGDALEMGVREVAVDAGYTPAFVGEVDTSESNA